MTAPPHSRPGKIDLWFLSLLACFFWILLLATHLINDTDIGFHLKGGQWILENHRFPSTDPYTYTVSDHPYLDAHWLYQVALFIFYRIGGYSLLSVLHTGLILLVFFFMYQRLKLVEAPLGLSVFLLAVATASSEIRFRTRPEILSWLLLSLTFWVLEMRASHKKDILFLLPILQLIWVNCEGLFILGWGLMGFYCVSDLFHEKKTDTKLFFYSFFSAVVCLVNPYFFKTILFPFDLANHLGSSSVFKNGIKELQSPWLASPIGAFAQGHPYWIYQAFSLTLLALLLSTFKNRKLHELLTTFAFFGLSFSAMRNIPLFMIACVPIAGACLRDLNSGSFRNFHLGPRAVRLLGILFLIFLTGSSFRVVTNAYYISNWRTERFGIGLDKKLQPVEACDFLVQNHLNGRILNTLDAGDWLDWKGSQKTFIDGRLEVIGENLFQEYSASLLPGGLLPLIEKYQPDIIFFSPLYAIPWIHDLQSLKNWRLVYEDGLIVIYLRKGYADNITDLEDGRLLSSQGVSKFSESDKAGLLGMERPSPIKEYWDGFYEPSEYPNDLQTMGIFNSQAGHPETAEALFLEAIRRTDGKYWTFYQNLGALYYYEKRYPEARLCAERVLKSEPRNPMARRILASFPFSEP